MQEHVQLTQKQINDDLLSSVLKTPRWWWPSVIVTGIIFLTGMGAFGYMLNQGVGVTGLNRPVFWARTWSTSCSSSASATPGS